MTKKAMDRELFSSRVNVDSNGCWIWTGALKRCARGTHRYGWLTMKNKQITAHRAAWILFVGEIPERMHVLHKCDVPQCCNPKHLFLGTHADNMKDKVSKGRSGNVGGARNVKLTVAQVDFIRKCLGVISQEKLGEMFGVTQGTVSHIANGRSWSWL